MYRPVDGVEVRCWDGRVGAIVRDDRSGFYVFEYERAWLRRSVELAPITMPTTASARRFVFPVLAPATFYRLPPMVADALPDDFGNALTTAYLAREGVAEGRITPLDRLAYLGGRGMGAMEFRPARGLRTPTGTAVELSELVVAARSVMSGPLDTEDGITAALSHLIAGGTSAGGAQAKVVVALNPETSELRSGEGRIPPGFEPWLLKLDGVDPDGDLGTSGHFGRVEYAYHRMATAAGIEMTECRLRQEGGRAHFMTRRFDRTDDGRKVHAQTLCAMAGLDFRQVGVHDYAQIFLVLERLGLGADTRAEAYRRMVFNVAGANCDHHTKNVSFLLAEGGRWRLSPAYDITHAHSPTSRWNRQHLMSVNGRTNGITRSDLDEVGDRFAVPGAAAIVDQVLQAVADWARFAATAGIPSDTTARIGRDIDTSAAPLR